jgi:hypothetical protein
MKTSRNASPWALLRFVRSEISVFLLVVFLHLAVGCSYYKVTKVSPKGTTVEGLAKSRKYIIVHQGENTWHLKNIVVDENKMEIRADSEPVGHGHDYYYTTKPKGPNRYYPKQGNPTYEVHLYIAEYAEGGSNQLIIPLSSLKKIEVYDKEMGATILTHVLGVVGVLLAAYVVIGIIVLLTKSSCPFVYIHDGESYHFAGELYGGAIYAPLERDDYLPLPGFAALDNQYQLKISNELLERQYTDLAELMVAEHPANSTVLIDRHGKLQTISNPVQPAKAVSEKNVEYTALLAKSDSSAYLFNEEAEAGKELSQLVLSFPNPAKAKTARLVLNARNSLWLDYLYGKFNEKFGTYFNTFAEKQKHVPAAKNLEWSKEQGLPLMVYLETENGWEPVDYFNVTGPLASRDLVMDIDLKKAKGGDVRLKLECGFMYWEIDYAALDFSEPVAATVTKLAPATAIDQTGKDVANLLAATDKKYLEQPEAGDQVVVNYPAPKPAAGKKQTVFLHSRGYYEYIRDYQNKPDLVSLNGFRKKGTLPRYSRQLYRQFVSSKGFISNALSQSNDH